ncbi:MAG TPA: hypothetical protein VJU78_19310, partial [Chitinophagaceae bacterium]|nr:hypothetical protein [Chitinophagaceae bacterium]
MTYFRFEILKIALFLALPFFEIVACEISAEKGEFDKNELLKNISSNLDDTLLSKSFEFIISNITYHNSEGLLFADSNGKRIELQIDTFGSIDTFKKFISENGYSVSSKIMADSTLLSNSFLKDDIYLAYQSWQSFPWSKKAGFELFKNYLLPYKILDEAPGKWRIFFLKKYRELLDSMAKVPGVTSYNVYDRIINQEIAKWFHYKKDYFAFTQSPSFEELMCIKEGECTRIAYIYTYALRSAGLPATVDFVPFWGSQNGGHAEVIFMDSTGRMVTYEKYRLGRSAKVFRKTFTRHMESLESSTYLKSQNDTYLTFLLSDHYLDVTNEHNLVSDIPFTLPDSIRAPIAYICIFNYGQWQPVFWSRVDKNNKIVFQNMGRDILYKIAVPKNSDIQFIGYEFLLDSSGKIRYKQPELRKLQQLKLHKINHGSESWVRKGNIYSLYYLNSKNEWQLNKTKPCLQDSVITFERV